MFIRKVTPTLILNSRKERTIRIDLETFGGRFSSSAPSGKSKGKNEVASYNGEGINKSLILLNYFCKFLKHKNFLIKMIDDLEQLTSLVRKFEEKYGKLGGNVTYVLESVFLKAAAADTRREVWQLINDEMNNGLKPKIPMPVGNCVGGGLHSKKIKNKRPDFQEFLLIPDEKSFSRAVTLNLRAYYLAEKLVNAKKPRRYSFGNVKRNDENALMTYKSNEEVLGILKRIAKEFNLRIGIDAAASTFYEGGYYKYKNKELIRDKVDQADYIERLVKKFGIFYVEDAMQEEDFSGFKEIMNVVGDETLIVGDDLTTTNLKYVRRAVQGNAINAIIIKPNQIGSILEVKRVVEFCKKNNIKTIFSHRSGETMDDILGDYCVGFGGDFIKTGIYGRERLIKLKRIIDIEKSLDKLF